LYVFCFFYFFLFFLGKGFATSGIQAPPLFFGLIQSDSGEFPVHSGPLSGRLSVSDVERSPQ
jgi:hypothetical protein